MSDLEAKKPLQTRRVHCRFLNVRGPIGIYLNVEVDYKHTCAVSVHTVTCISSRKILSNMGKSFLVAIFF